ncbi:MAG: endoribonuclease [Chloroflexi bacterium]|nr:endoribonuclease [Chloroflexota bacterium]
MANKREIISLPGIPHNAPLPTGAKIGNIIVSSAISGREPGSGEFSDDPERQAEALFDNIRAFMEKAGGSPDNIISMTLYIKDQKYGEALNKAWIKMFPEENRPAREGHIKTDGMYGGRFFDASLIAVL